MREMFRDSLAEMGVLVVDDEPSYLEMSRVILESMGYRKVFATDNGPAALAILAAESIDVVITDVNMPEMDGVTLLRRIKEDPNHSDIPVIMVSGVEQLDTVVECIGQGAEDYLHKPIKEPLLWARVQATLERKYLRDLERELFAQVEREKKKSEAILYNLIPESIADRLRLGEQHIAEVFSDCTVLFADIVGFTALSSELTPSQLVSMINTLFHAFDRLVEVYELEKIKTNGDSYIVVGGLAENESDHADKCLQFSRQILKEIKTYNAQYGMNLAMRVGLNTGPVVAGVVGTTRFSFDLWGDTVNLASRMENTSQPNCVHLTESTHRALTGEYGLERRGAIEIKGKKDMIETFLLRGAE